MERLLVHFKLPPCKKEKEREKNLRRVEIYQQYHYSFLATGTAILYMKFRLEQCAHPQNSLHWAESECFWDLSQESQDFQKYRKDSYKKSRIAIFCIYTHSLFDFILKLEGFVWEKQLLLFYTSHCGWVERVVFPIQILLIFGGRCNRFF